jgi:adenylylsulfate kinase
LSNTGAAYLFTGLSGAGKTTISTAVAELLRHTGVPLLLLDGDQLRNGLCSDLGYSKEDRFENIRRAGEVARLFMNQGFVCLCAFICPYQEMRDMMRQRLEPTFFEIHVDCSLEECRRRDPKKYYKQAQDGKIVGFTGVGAPYEVPKSPDLRLDTVASDIEKVAEIAYEFVMKTRQR